MNLFKRIFHKHEWMDHLIDGNSEIGECTTMRCKCGEYKMFREANLQGEYTSIVTKLDKNQYEIARKEQKLWLRKNKK